MTQGSPIFAKKRCSIGPHLDMSFCLSIQTNNYSGAVSPARYYFNVME